ncbi:hypothetical protein [Roseospira visakhapatnamensis]|uniref:Uncharacterized protein n=1 Tax=Roseospira visakhapatnamensis TaxID=390880 RepID=A0A7W6WAL9_9PROT|nr:hypothetical protein [Roseospira visakhapatnamensis]MBB4266642.1 hypothetical protein [Roseospira visakhapatnamensis]
MTDVSQTGSARQESRRFDTGEIDMGIGVRAKSPNKSLDVRIILNYCGDLW